jgi:hypothetical protein
MKKSVLLAFFGLAMTTVASVPAFATTTGFDFTQCTTGSNYYGNAQTESGTCGSASYSNTSNSFSQTVTGVGTVTATAYSTAAGAARTAGTAISSGTKAFVGQYTGNGIGVCSVGDAGYSSSGGGCTAPDHQVDDSGSYEFILFTFSTPVDINTITLANFGGGPLSALDISYWVNPSSLTTIPPAATNVLCGGGGGAGSCPTVEGNGGGIGVGSLTDTINTVNVTTLLVGADTGDTDTYFKIQGLGGVTDYVHTATPEPATFGMFGFALVGLGLIARKRKQS